jgi:hypothetical protein
MAHPVNEGAILPIFQMKAKVTELISSSAGIHLLSPKHSPLEPKAA